jgi:protocatechuate 3,4-dioxygenase beta subunit
MRVRTSLLFLFLLGLVSAAAAQEPAPAEKPAAKCVVAGQVVKAGTGEPLKKARVGLSKVEGREPAKVAITDANGRFVFRDIEAGRYRLTAARNGYARQQYGQRGPGKPGTILSLAPGQQEREIVFRLQPAAVIAGRVRDEDGELLASVRVQAMQYRYSDGRRQLYPAGQALTNDRGEYRIFGLAAGRYYVSATYSPSLGSMLEIGGVVMTEGPGRAVEEDTYIPTYFPGTNEAARATPIELKAGGEAAGIDFLLLPTRGVRLVGMVSNAVAGKPPRDIVVHILPAESDTVTYSLDNMARPDAEGRFEFRNVAPGSYVLEAGWYDRENQEFYRAQLPVTVTGDNLEGLHLVIRPGVEIAGSLRVEGVPAKAAEEAPAIPGASDERPDKLDWTELSVVLDPRGARGPMRFGGASGPVRADGTFTIANVADDAYRVQVWRLPADYYLKAVRMEGEDVLEEGLAVSGPPNGPLEVVISANGGRVEGVVQKDGKPFSGATVTLIPAAAMQSDTKRPIRPELYRSTTTDQYGRFVLRGIPPGEYQLFAWEEIEPGAHQDSEFLKPYEKLGHEVTVEEGSRLSAELKLIPAGDPPR